MNHKIGIGFVSMVTAVVFAIGNLTIIETKAEAVKGGKAMVLQQTKTVTDEDIQPIDKSITAKIETATFALG
jgi:hypothetical protein